MPWNRKDYPPDWEERRARILQRAGFRCEKCGVANGFIFHWVAGKRLAIREGHWDLVRQYKRKGYSERQALTKLGFTTVVLTIAHLDHDKDNWEVMDERLAAWCQRCHLAHDLAHHIDNRKYGRNFRKNQYKLF